MRLNSFIFKHDIEKLTANSLSLMLEMDIKIQKAKKFTLISYHLAVIEEEFLTAYFKNAQKPANIFFPIIIFTQWKVK